jgi:hypothetical protein
MRVLLSLTRYCVLITPEIRIGRDYLLEKSKKWFLTPAQISLIAVGTAKKITVLCVLPQTSDISMLKFSEHFGLTFPALISDANDSVKHATSILHHNDFSNRFISSYMIKTIKRKWSGHVARTRKMRNVKCTW